MPPGRRATGPIDLDPSPLYDRDVSDESDNGAADRDAHVPEAVLATVSVLGVCGRLPHVDGGAKWEEPAAVGRQVGFRDVDVRGA